MASETTEWVQCVVCGHRRKVDYNRVKHSPELFEVEGRPGERFRGHYCATHHVSGFPPPADAGREALIDALDKVAQDLTPGVIRMRAFQQCKRCDQMRSSSGNFCNDCHRQLVSEARTALAREGETNG